MIGISTLGMSGWMQSSQLHSIHDMSIAEFSISVSQLRISREIKPDPKCPTKISEYVTSHACVFYAISWFQSYHILILDLIPCPISPTITSKIVLQYVIIPCHLLLLQRCSVFCQDYFSLIHLTQVSLSCMEPTSFLFTPKVA